MPQAQRIGDVNDAGGTIIATPQTFVFIDGRLASVIGSGVSSHATCPTPPIHCAAVVISGSAIVFIQGIPAVRSGDSDSCGHTRIGGSPTVFIS